MTLTTPTFSTVFDHSMAISEARRFKFAHFKKLSLFQHLAFVLTSINGSFAFDKLLSKSHEFIAQKKSNQFKDEIKRNLLQIR